MRVLLVVLFVLALLAVTVVAFAMPRATAAVATSTLDLALIRGSPPVATIVATSTYMANSYDTADYLGTWATPTPTARTGPHFVTFTPCADYSNGLHGTYPAALTADNLGARRLDGSILQTITGRTTTTTTSAAFA